MNQPNNPPPTDSNELREAVTKEIQSLKDGLDTDAVNAAKIQWCQETEDNVMALFASYTEKRDAAQVEKNKSFCGCPMCPHHTEAYAIQASRGGQPNKGEDNATGS